MKLNSNAGRFLLAAALLAVVVVFYPKTPDVRLTLCQDLTQLLVNPAKPEWQTHTSVIKGYKDFEMQIQFVLTDINGQTSTAQASCFFPYEQDDIGAETFQIPSSAYSTYPSMMLFNGQIVDKKRLTESINEVMKKQAKKVLNNIKS